MAEDIFNPLQDEPIETILDIVVKNFSQIIGFVRKINRRAQATAPPRIHVLLSFHFVDGNVLSDAEWNEPYVSLNFSMHPKEKSLLSMKFTRNMLVQINYKTFETRIELHKLLEVNSKLLEFLKREINLEKKKKGTK